MKLPPAFVVLTCAGVALAATVANVISDIIDINTGVRVLDSRIMELPSIGGNISSALSVHTAVGFVKLDVTFATSDITNVTPLPISEADAISVINAVDTFRNNVVPTLTDLVTKRPAFGNLSVSGVPALILADLNDFSVAIKTFEAALIAKTPANLLRSASSYSSVINQAIATAIAAYS